MPLLFRVCDEGRAYGRVGVGAEFSESRPCWERMDKAVAMRVGAPKFCPLSSMQQKDTHTPTLPNTQIGDSAGQPLSLNQNTLCPVLPYPRSLAVVSSHS